MTVNADGHVDDAGVSLAAFLEYLHETEGVTAINLVGHSMGGLFSRAAIRVLQQSASKISIRSLTTIGTPHWGSFAAEFAYGYVPLSSCGSGPYSAFCELVMTAFNSTAHTHSTGAAADITYANLAGPAGWNAAQAGVLDGIPVTLLAGDIAVSEGGDPRVWPMDGLVTAFSAQAAGMPLAVMPIVRGNRTFNDTHSIFLSDTLALPWSTALTWDPEVLALVVDAIHNPGSPAPAAQ